VKVKGSYFPLFCYSLHHKELESQMYTGWCGETLKLVFVLRLNYVIETRDSLSSKIKQQVVGKWDTDA